MSDLEDGQAVCASWTIAVNLAGCSNVSLSAAAASEEPSRCFRYPPFPQLLKYLLSGEYVGYVEGLSDVGTKLGELFGGLLKSDTGSSHHEHRAGGVSQQTFGHAAEIEPLALRQITRADHQQLVMASLDMFHDSLDHMVHVDLSDNRKATFDELTP